MLMRIANFFKTGPDAGRAPLSGDDLRRTYEARRWKVFAGIWIGYGVFYVTRLGFSVVKKPIIDSGILNAEQLGRIGSLTLIVYAVGKFLNSVLGDRSNVRKFISFGLLISALMNLAVGLTSVFWAFLALWAVNGWFQSMGCGPCVVGLSQWFGKKERGTLYGVWSAAHAIGEMLSFVCFSLVVGWLGWRAGFGAAGLAGILMALGLVFLLSDRPETYGLPNVKEYKNEPAQDGDQPQESLLRQQLRIMRYPAIWVLGIASALNYVTRYGINGWGMLYLQEVKLYSIEKAGAVLGISSLVGIAGTIASGFISDRLFQSNRHKTTLLYGLIQITALLGFFFAPAHLKWLNTLCIGAYGFAMGGTLAFLGGLTAIDLVPRRVTGAAMGFIGLMSYAGASLQDLASGHLLEKSKHIIDGKVAHNFDAAILVWIGASVLSIALAMTLWNIKSCDE